MYVESRVAGEIICPRFLEVLHSAAVATCIVSYIGADDLRHSVEVQADSLYESAALAIRAFREHDREPGPSHKLEVEVRTSVPHKITRDHLEKWLSRSPRSPSDLVLKERLRATPSLNLRTEQ